MTDVLPVHPLTNQREFRNPSQVKVATWEVMKPYAQKVLHITTWGNETKWLEKTWRVVEKTIWGQYSDAFEWHRVVVRMFALAEVVHIYCHLSDIDQFSRDSEYSEWVDECDLSKVKLAVLCGEEYLEDSMVDYDQGSPFDIVNHLIEEEYPRMIKVVEDALGGPQGFIKGLYDWIHDTEDEERITVKEAMAHGYEIKMSRETHFLIEWRDSGWPRGGVDGCEI